MNLSRLKIIAILVAIFFVCAAPRMNEYDETTSAPSESDYIVYYQVDGSSYITKRISVLHLLELLESSMTDFEINSDNVAGSSGPAEQVSVTDDEATASNYPLLFGGTDGGGDITVRSDGTTYYTPSTGTITATAFSGDGSALTSVEAATGDRATGFFDEGTIEHERGGLEADVSGYGGIVGITGGATYDVDTTQKLEDALTGAGAYFSDMAAATSKANMATIAGVGTGDSPQFTGIEVGHADDTTITRGEAGVIEVQGDPVLMASAIGSTIQGYDADTAKTDNNEAITGHWVQRYDSKELLTASPTASLLRKGDTVKASVASWDPVGKGGTDNYETSIVETTTELMPNQVDRDFSGASAWANVDINSYDETTDLTVTANAADQYCTLAALSAPTTDDSYYAIHFDVANLVGTWTIKDFDGTNTIGTISAEGTGQYIIFQADDSNGGLRLVSNGTTSSADFDNFSLTLMSWQINKDDTGRTYVQSNQSVPNLITTAGDLTITADNINSIVEITAAGDIIISADLCDTATANWLEIKQTGIFDAEVQVLDAADDFELADGTAVEGSTNELSVGGAAGDTICIRCSRAHKLVVWSEMGTGASDAGATD